MNPDPWTFWSRSQYDMMQSTRKRSQAQAERHKRAVERRRKAKRGGPR